MDTINSRMVLVTVTLFNNVMINRRLVPVIGEDTPVKVAKLVRVEAHKAWTSLYPKSRITPSDLSWKVETPEKRIISKSDNYLLSI